MPSESDMEKGRGYPFVSLVINNYNYGHFLPRLFDSIVSQSFTDYEVVIVNDCSIDDSDSVIREFIENNPDKRIRYINSKKRLGIGEGQNSGLAAADGIYVMFIDADDWMDPDCLEILVSKAKADNADRVIGSFRYVDTDGKILKKQIIEGDLNSRWLYTMQQANLFRRSIFVENGIRISNTRFQDNESVLRFNEFCTSVSYV